MLTVCAGLFVFITKLGSDDFPVGALVAMTMLLDFILVLLSIAMLIDTGTLQNLVAILGGCR